MPAGRHVRPGRQFGQQREGLVVSLPSSVVSKNTGRGAQAEVPQVRVRSWDANLGLSGAKKNPPRDRTVEFQGWY
jgi:hypothetical protein